MRNPRLLLAGAGALLLAGCFGTFELSRKLYKWNESIEPKFLETAVFYALAIVPVYQTTLALDFAVFNLIEFWSGENPLAEVPPELPDGTQLRPVADGPGAEAVAVDGRLLYRALPAADGGVVVVDAAGAEVLRAQAPQVRALARALVARNAILAAEQVGVLRHQARNRKGGAEPAP